MCVSFFTGVLLRDIRPDGGSEKRQAHGQHNDQPKEFLVLCRKKKRAYHVSDEPGLKAEGRGCGAAICFLCFPFGTVLCGWRLSCFSKTAVMYPHTQEIRESCAIR